jgi:hypothetical protein
VRLVARLRASTLGVAPRLRASVPVRSSQRSLKPSPSVSRWGFVWKPRTSAPSRRRSRSGSRFAKGLAVQANAVHEERNRGPAVYAKFRAPKQTRH